MIQHMFHSYSLNQIYSTLFTLKNTIHSRRFITSFKNIITSLDNVFTSFPQDFKCLQTYISQIVYYIISCSYYTIQLGYHFILLGHRRRDGLDVSVHRLLPRERMKNTPITALVYVESIHNSGECCGCGDRHCRERTISDGGTTCTYCNEVIIILE